jgi:hypothetical protein
MEIIGNCVANDPKQREKKRNKAGKKSNKSQLQKRG